MSVHVGKLGKHRLRLVLGPMANYSERGKEFVRVYLHLGAYSKQGEKSFLFLLTLPWFALMVGVHQD